MLFATLITAAVLQASSMTPSLLPADFQATVVQTASQQIGKPYCRGGQRGRCFDCSGLTKYAYKSVGVSLPGIVSSQLAMTNKISKDQAQPGDLVFFKNSKGYAYHVGIYMGNNKVLHAPKPGRKVRVEEIWSSRVVFATL